MNKFSTLVLSSLFILCITLSSCEAIGNIFKAGVWAGVIGIALVVFLILYLIGKARK